MNKVVFDAMLDEEAMRRLDWIKKMRSQGWGEEDWMDWYTKWHVYWREFLSLDSCYGLRRDMEQELCGSPSTSSNDSWTSQELMEGRGAM